MEGGKIFSANGHIQTGLGSFLDISIYIDFSFTSAGKKKKHNSNSSLIPV